MQTIYLRLLAALVLLACASYGGWAARGWKEDAAQLKRLQSDFERQERERRENGQENQRLRQLLAKKASPGVNRAVADNPSGCKLPAPVRDELHSAIDAANAAIRDAGDLPADPEARE